MTYLDNDTPDYESNTTIYPPSRPLPHTHRRAPWLGPLMGWQRTPYGWQSPSDQAINQQRQADFERRNQIYQNKMIEAERRTEERQRKEQDRLEREHRAEQVKIAEQRAKLDESIAKQKYWNDELQKLERQQQEIQSARPKTSAQLATDKRQIETAKKNLSKATEDLDNFARAMEPLMKGLRGNRPADVDYKQYKENEQQALERYRVSAAPPKTVPGYFGGFFGDTTNPDYTKYKQNEQAALDLYRGTSKATKAQGEPVRPGFKSTYGAYEAAREGVPIAEEKLAEQQEKLQRADDEFQRTRMMPIEERRLVAERGLSDEAAKQQAAQQVIDAYQKGGAELPLGSPAPQGGVSGGNVQRESPSQAPFTQSPPQAQPQFGPPRLGGVQNGVSPGGKGAIPIPIIGPILSAVGSAMAGGKGGGGMMGPAQAQMPPQAPAGGFSPLSPSTVAPPLRFQPEQWSPLSPMPVAPPSQLQGPQMQAGQPPAIEQPATPGVQKATYEGEPYTYAEPGGPQSAAGYGQEGAPVVVGDSIGLGLQRELGTQGNSEIGRSPSAVLAAIQSNPKMFSGRDVVLSSGASNDTKAVGLLAKQIEALKAAGAKSISVMGVGDRKDFRGLNDQLSKIAGSMGARFLGPLQNLSKDHVHARSYRNIINQIRRSATGATNDRGAPTTLRQREVGPTARQPPVFTQWQGSHPTVAGPAGSAAQQIISDVSEWNRSHPQQHLDPRLPLGLARYEGTFDQAGNVPASSYKHWDQGAYSRGPYQLRDIGLGSGFARQFGLPTPSNIHQQDQYVFPYLARGQLKPWSAVRDRGLPAIYAAGGNLLKQFGGGQPTQMAAAAPQGGTDAGFARGSGRTFPADQRPPSPQQEKKKVNPIAAGLSAIQPAKPTVEMTEPAPLPPLQQPQKTPFIPLPFAPEKATSMDHLAQAGLLSGMSREQVMALMKKTMPNDQPPAWLMQQQQEQQGADAGE